MKDESKRRFEICANLARKKKKRKKNREEKLGEGEVVCTSDMKE
jgi:hypothetical protein